MLLTDIANSDQFSMNQMIEQINKIPSKPGFITSLGLYDVYGITTTDVAIAEENGELKVLQTSQRGAPGRQINADKRTLRKLSTVHLKAEATITADEVAGVAEFDPAGNAVGLRTMEAERDRRLLKARNFIDVTKENLMLGGILGVIYDADGSVIYDLFNEFGVTQPAAIDFDFAGTPEVKTSCSAVRRTMRRNLKIGMTPFECHALVGDNFFDALMENDDVKEAHKRFEDSAFLRENQAHDSVPFGGIMWHNYAGFDEATSGSDPADTAAGTGVGINKDEARFFPVGVDGVFEMPHAPADWVATVNQTGLPYYAAADLDRPGPNARAIEIEAQANPLPICNRPMALLTGTIT
ncbi:MAG: major capsid protein [Alphaproteobacteria bacterium]